MSRLAPEAGGTLLDQPLVALLLSVRTGSCDGEVRAEAADTGDGRAADVIAELVVSRLYS